MEKFSNVGSGKKSSLLNLQYDLLAVGSGGCSILAAAAKGSIKGLLRCSWEKF